MGTESETATENAQLRNLLSQLLPRDPNVPAPGMTDAQRVAWLDEKSLKPRGLSASTPTKPLRLPEDDRLQVSRPEKPRWGEVRTIELPPFTE